MCIINIINEESTELIMCMKSFVFSAYIILHAHTVRELPHLIYEHIYVQDAHVGCGTNERSFFQKSKQRLITTEMPLFFINTHFLMSVHISVLEGKSCSLNKHMN